MRNYYIQTVSNLKILFTYPIHRGEGRGGVKQQVWNFGSFLQVLYGFRQSERFFPKHPGIFRISISGKPKLRYHLKKELALLFGTLSAIE